MRRCIAIVAAMLFGLHLAGCDDARPGNSQRTPPPRASVQDGEMCTEHGVPEALCTRCNPALANVFKAKGDWCAEHEFPASFCPVCDPDTAFPSVESTTAEVAERPSVADIEGRVVRFRTPQIEAKVGLETVEAVTAQTAADVSCSARLSFDANRVADIRAIVPGIVREVRVQLGQVVKEGDRLFDLESARVGDLQAELQRAQERVRAAQANVGRQRELRVDQISSARQVELAEQELATAEADRGAARAALRMAGAARSGASGRYVLRAPVDGEVVRRPAVVGMLATDEASLATIADTSTMWALCEIPEREASRVRAGQKVALELADGPRTGVITWLSPEVDARTRTVTARAEVPNPDRLLRANQFVSARILADAPATAVTVPREAIQRVEGHEVVFVRSEAGIYLPRVVEQSGDGELVAVSGKVEPGDLVVTQGAVFLRTEVMPGSIGAGCCEVDLPRGE